jgi:hypothetical protein
MKDGLYQVMGSYFCAGFVVQGEKIIRLAPILRKWNKDMLLKIGVWICK